MVGKLSRGAVATCLLSCILSTCGIRLAGAVPYGEDQAPAVDAPALVTAALEAEAAGDFDRRAKLLADAVAADGDYAPARWLNGEIRFEGRWRDLVEVGAIVNHDPRWQEYAELRASTANTLEGHLGLAQWCFRNGLENEERFHWANVLARNPRHELGRARLGLEERNGVLYAKQFIAQQEQRLAAIEKAVRRETPRLEELCKKIESADDAEHSTGAQRNRNRR